MVYNELELTEIYNRNINMLYRICYNLLKGNTSLIDDAVQNIFYRMMKKK